MSTRILIIDDSAAFRGGLRTMLEVHDGWEVCEAVDGADGIKKNRALAPHLIIMDMAMPGMTGIQAAAAILKEFPKTPIVLLTLYFASDLAEEARKVGIRAMLSKTKMSGFVGDLDAILRGEEFVVPAIEQRKPDAPNSGK
jgi:DNA-binding NarL/FixJ family response regulator